MGLDVWPSSWGGAALGEDSPNIFGLINTLFLHYVLDNDFWVNSPNADWCCHPMLTAAGILGAYCRLRGPVQCFAGYCDVKYGHLLEGEKQKGVIVNTCKEFNLLPLHK